LFGTIFARFPAAGWRKWRWAKWEGEKEGQQAFG
jgi:hypothetical protein